LSRRSEQACAPGGARPPGKHALLLSMHSCGGGCSGSLSPRCVCPQCGRGLAAQHGVNVVWRGRVSSCNALQCCRCAWLGLSLSACAARWQQHCTASSRIAHSQSPQSASSPPPAPALLASAPAPAPPSRRPLSAAAAATAVSASSPQSSSSSPSAGAMAAAGGDFVAAGAGAAAAGE
jgi:hypothetical protein